MTAKTTHTVLRWFAASTLACAGSSLCLGACASSEELVEAQEPDASAILPPADAGSSIDGDVERCTADDCEFYPAECAPDVFCPSGPFHPTDPTGGMDWRTRVFAILGRSRSDVWMAGAAGSVAHYDGTSWRLSELAVKESQRVLWLPSRGEVTMANPLSVRTRGLPVADAGEASAGGWTKRAITLPAGYSSREVWSAWAPPGADTLWVGSADSLWRLRLTEDSELVSLAGIGTAACNDIQCGRLRRLHGASAGTLFGVGETGRIVRITGADTDTPTALPLNSRTWVGLNSVWAASDTNAWAVGGTGTIRHYTGDEINWDVVSDVPTDVDLNAVWGTSPDDVWAVGDAGVVLHFDGQKWSRMKIAGLGNRRPDLYAVWAPEPGHVWIGGHGILVALGGKP